MKEGLGEEGGDGGGEVGSWERGVWSFRPEALSPTEPMRKWL
jgi:hypothetical protein